MLAFGSSSLTRKTQLTQKEEKVQINVHKSDFPKKTPHTRTFLKQQRKYIKTQADHSARRTRADVESAEQPATHCTAALTWNPIT